MIDLQRIYSSM